MLTVLATINPEKSLLWDPDLGPSSPSRTYAQVVYWLTWEANLYKFPTFPIFINFLLLVPASSGNGITYTGSTPTNTSEVIACPLM